MEELLKKVVNLGIGAVKTLEENMESTFKNAEQSINEMVAKGETSNDENAQRVRQVVDELLKSVNEYEARAREISDSLSTTLQEFDPSGGVEQLKQKVDELSNKVQGGGSTGSRSTTSGPSSSSSV